MKQIFLVVDGNSILNRAFYGIRSLSTRDGTPTNAVYGMVNIVTHHWEALQPTHAVMAFDVREPTFRHKMYEEYKAGRRPAPPELLAQFPLAKECASALGFHVIEKAGYEADDILGTMARLAHESKMDCYLLTGDRDALQLIDERVHVLLAGNTETVDYTESVFKEKYGVEPGQFVDVKALMGDSSDHIPGVPGIGEKTALRLIADYGSLDGVYAALPEAKVTPSVRKKLEEGRDSAYLSRQLAEICREVPLNMEPSAWKSDGICAGALLDLFTRLEFSALIKRMNLPALAKGSTPTTEERTSKPLVRKEITAKEIQSYLAAEQVLALGVDGDSLQICMGNQLMICRTDPEEREKIQQVLDGYDGEWVCYDCKSLYHALDALGIHFRGCTFDVMLAAYVINAGEGHYELPRLVLSYLGETLPEEWGAGEELPYVHQLYPVLREKLRTTDQEAVFDQIEMPLSAVLTDMEEEGFHICTEGIRAYGEQLEDCIRDLENRVYTYVGREFNLNSPKQLGEVLFGEDGLQLPAPKKSKTGYSTSAEVLEKLRPYHPVIEDILDYRQYSKLKSTYVDGLLKVVAEDGQIHTNFKQTGTATGRLSSAEPNLQNIPIRTEIGRELRRYFVPRHDGYVLIDADYSQIELRLLAAISGDRNMQQAFCHGQDIHTSTAATVFGVPPEMVTSEMRKRAKAINFGILYGMGDFSLGEDLHISRKEAKAYIEHYLSSYPAVDQYLEEVKQKAAEQGYVTTMFGRRRYIPELSSSNKMIRSFGERVAMNSPIQGTAADIIKKAMIAVHRRLKQEGLDARLILQVHDELLLEAREDCAEKALELLRWEMEHAVELSVPLDVSTAVGENWLDAK